MTIANLFSQPIEKLCVAGEDICNIPQDMADILRECCSAKYHSDVVDVEVTASTDSASVVVRNIVVRIASYRLEDV